MADRSHYTFGDNQLAALRLQLLASTFEPSSRQLLLNASDRPPSHALDVGCGPGFTSALVASATRARSVTGFDQSEAFLAEAAQRVVSAETKFSWVCGNVLEPLKTPTADFIYCRFLLTHLNAPELALANLKAAATPDATIVLEEIEQLQSASPVLARYYELVAALQSAHGQSLTVGSQIQRSAEQLGLSVLFANSTPLSLQGSNMPRLHQLNISTWRRDPAMQTIASTAELDDLEAALKQLVDAGSATVNCTLKQLILQAK